MSDIILGWDPAGRNRWNYAAVLAQAPAPGLHLEPWGVGRGAAAGRKTTAPRKQQGLAVRFLDRAAPGVYCCALLQISGEARFNELFLDDVFVPDVDVVGPVDGGWGVARITLGHERVSLGDGSAYSGSDGGWSRLLDLAPRVVLKRHAPLPTPVRSDVV